MLCDFHLHTNKSDGVLSPTQLFDEIRDRELRFFSITDHDTLDAYPLPGDLQERSICGLEVDSHHRGRSAHILAYGEQEGWEPLLRVLGTQREDRRGRMHAMVARLRALGLDICMEDVLAQAATPSSLARPHLARALVVKGVVDSTQQAFDRFLADDAQGYVPLSRLESHEAIRLIHECGGVAVVAHPVRLDGEETLDDLIDLGVDGIEVVHPTASPEDERMLRAHAMERNLLVTGGTDFHAPVPDRPIGIDFPSEDVDALLARIVQRRRAHRDVS